MSIEQAVVYKVKCDGCGASPHVANTREQALATALVADWKQLTFNGNEFHLCLDCSKQVKEGL
jgi:hypothetical protein